MSVQHHKTRVERVTSWVGSISSLVVHTALFAGAFFLGASGFVEWEIVLLVLTTLVSLEAIYLAIFIQMTVNRQAASIKEVEENVDEIQEDIEELGENVDEIQENVEELGEDVEDIQEDIEEIAEDEAEEKRKNEQKVTLEQLTTDVRRVLDDLEALKGKK